MRLAMLALLLVSVAGVASSRPDYHGPNTTPPPSDRFVEYDVPGRAPVIVMKDTVTGCEYIRTTSINSSYELLVGSCNE